MTTELEELRQQGLLRRRRVVTPLAGGGCEIDGKTLRNFAGNDYLDLARDPRVVAAAVAATQSDGAGASASALVTGRTKWHDELERRIASFEGAEQALLFPTGYAANVGTLSALAGADDEIFCDRLNHASLVDGCRLSGARMRVYRHDDLEGLEQALHKSAGARRRLIVSDAVFSMDGDLAPLPELCDLAERFDALLVLDEAHATGVLGDRGRGLAELAGVEARVPVRTGTLSKAFGALGGFVSGSATLVDWLWNKARPQMFSTALPPSACAAASASIEISETEPWRRQRLRDLGIKLREQFAAAGIETPHGLTGPIVPVILKSPDRVIEVARELEARGHLVASIRPPTVPRDTSRLRISLSAGHTNEDLQGLTQALTESLQPPN